MTNLKVGAALLGIALLLIWGAERSGERRGAGRVRDSIFVANENTAQREVARTDTIFKRDTLTLVKRLVQFDSVRTTDTLVRTVQLEGKRDSVIVYIPRATADSVVSACTDVLHSCTLRVKTADSLNLILRAHVNLLESQQPSRWGTIFNRALYFGAGLGIGTLVHR